VTQTVGKERGGVPTWSVTGKNKLGTTLPIGSDLDGNLSISQLPVNNGVRWCTEQGHYRLKRVDPSACTCSRLV